MSKFHLEVRHQGRNNDTWAHLMTAESGDSRRQFSDDAQINALRKERTNWFQNYPQRFTNQSEFRITKSQSRLDPMAEVIIPQGAY